MAIAMVAMLAFGGTYAYFTASVNSTGSATVTSGTLTMGGTLTLTNVAKIVPNQAAQIGNLGSVTVTGTTIAAYRAKVNITSVQKDGEDVAIADYPLLTIGILTSGNEADTNWAAPTTADGYLYYNKTMAGTSVGTLSTIANQVAVKLDANAGNAYQGLVVTLSVTFEATQAEYNGNNGSTYGEGSSITADQAAALIWTETVA